jgi:hypothetical protein
MRQAVGIESQETQLRQSASERVLLVGTGSAKGIMASGHARRTDRSNTWPHQPKRTASRKPLPTESRPHMADCVEKLSTGPVT